MVMNMVDMVHDRAPVMDGKPVEIKAKVYLIGLSGLVINTLSEFDHV